MAEASTEWWAIISADRWANAGRWADNLQAGVRPAGPLLEVDPQPEGTRVRWLATDDPMDALVQLKRLTGAGPEDLSVQPQRVQPPPVG